MSKLIFRKAPAKILWTSVIIGSLMLIDVRADEEIKVPASEMKPPLPEIPEETNLVSDATETLNKKMKTGDLLPINSTAVEVPLCDLPPLLPGYENKTCLETATWFTHERSSGLCVRFTYSGCGKSANLFPTEDECRKACIRQRANNADCLLICPTNYAPLCGSNNVTYANECEIKAFACREKQNITIAYTGACTDKPQNATEATSTSQPTHVANDDSAASSSPSPEDSLNRICKLTPIVPGFNRTCFAALPRFTFDVKAGKCVRYLYGGCGGSENLFRTEYSCKAACPDIKIDGKIGEGTPTPTATTPKPCPNVCPAVEDPVCGTDGMTYPNSCVLEVSSCTKNLDVRVAYLGACRPNYELFCPECTSLDEPVCASNGETFKNACEMERRACLNRADLMVAHVGPCESMDDIDRQNATIVPKERSPACDVPIYQGPCYISTFRKWGFNQDTGRCEWFYYGGCMGNDNRFDTPYDCQMACGGSEPLTDFTCDQRKCPWKVWAHYLAQGCKPVYELGKCCPTRFDCPSYKTSDNGEPQCTYEGQVYKIGDEIPSVKDHEPCFQKCICKQHPEDTNVATIDCEQTECTLFHGALDIFEKSCRKIYQKGRCCPSSIKCDDFQYGVNNMFFCEYDGRKYVEGERIDLPDQGKQCYCNQAWVHEGGPMSSACQPVSCAWESQHLSHLQRGCAPVWKRGQMCPIDWVCPEDRKIVPEVPPSPINPSERREAIEVDTYFDEEEDMEALFSSDPFFDEPTPFLTVPAATARKGATPQYGCSLGVEKFNVEESFEVNRGNRWIKCSCVTPPGLTCEDISKNFSPLSPTSPALPSPAGPGYLFPKQPSHSHHHHHHPQKHHSHFQHRNQQNHHLTGHFYRGAAPDNSFRWSPSRSFPASTNHQGKSVTSRESTSFPNGWKVMMKYKRSAGTA